METSKTFMWTKKKDLETCWATDPKPDRSSLEVIAYNVI